MLQTAGCTSKVLAKFLMMLSVGLLLLALFYGVELLLAVAAVASMNVCVFSRATVVMCMVH